MIKSKFTNAQIAEFMDIMGRDFDNKIMEPYPFIHKTFLTADHFATSKDLFEHICDLESGSLISLGHDACFKKINESEWEICP